MFRNVMTLFQLRIPFSGRMISERLSFKNVTGNWLVLRWCSKYASGVFVGPVTRPEASYHVWYAL